MNSAQLNRKLEQFEEALDGFISSLLEMKERGYLYAEIPSPFHFVGIDPDNIDMALKGPLPPPQAAPRIRDHERKHEPEETNFTVPIRTDEMNSVGETRDGGFKFSEMEKVSPAKYDAYRIKCLAADYTEGKLEWEWFLDSNWWEGHPDWDRDDRNRPEVLIYWGPAQPDGQAFEMNRQYKTMVGILNELYRESPHQASGPVHAPYTLPEKHRQDLFTRDEWLSGTELPWDELAHCEELIIFLSELGYRPIQKTAIEIVSKAEGPPWEIPDKVWEGIGFEIHPDEVQFQDNMTDLSIHWTNFAKGIQELDWNRYHNDDYCERIYRYRAYFIDQASWLEAAALTAVLHNADWGYEEVPIADIAKHVWRYTMKAIYELQNPGAIPTKDEAQAILGDEAFHACGATLCSIGWVERAYRNMQSRDSNNRGPWPPEYLILKLFGAIETEWKHRLGNHIERKYGKQMRDLNLPWWFLGFRCQGDNKQDQEQMKKKMKKAIASTEADISTLEELFGGNDFHKLRKLGNKERHDIVPPTDEDAEWAYDTFIGSENAWMKRFLRALPE